MRFVLLGDDRNVLPLVRAIAGHAGHTLTRAALAQELQGDLMRLAPAVRLTGDWDELLAGEDFDAAIVAGYSADVLLAARQLAQSGAALVVFPDVRQGAEFVYELTLIRDDSQAALVPVFPRRFDRMFREFAESLRSTGRLLHIVMEREQPATVSSGMAALLTQSQIDAALIEDADLLRSLGGDYNQATALYSGRAADGVAAASVVLAGENLPEATWSLKAAPRAAWRITATTHQGTVSRASADQPPRGPEPQPPGETADEAGPLMLEHIERALSGRNVSPDWTELARVFETVEAARRSVIRRRTIDLHFETTSERSQFKTKMTALGCGLLSVTFVGVLLVLLVGTVFRGGRDERELQRLLDEGWTIERIAADPDRLPGHDVAALRRMRDRMEFGRTVMRIARIAVFLPLAVFLVLQLLVFVARPPKSQQKI